MTQYLNTSFANMMEGPEYCLDKPLNLKQVGWLVAGGFLDGVFIPWPYKPEEVCKDFRHFRHGSFSPVYIEMGGE